MKIENIDIRILIRESGLTCAAVAEQMGISRQWLSTLLSRELSTEQRNRIWQAIHELREEEDYAGL